MTNSMVIVSVSYVRPVVKSFQVPKRGLTMLLNSDPKL